MFQNFDDNRAKEKRKIIFISSLDSTSDYPFVNAVKLSFASPDDEPE
jgi:hypothetical protein